MDVGERVSGVNVVITGFAPHRARNVCDQMHALCQWSHPRVEHVQIIWNNRPEIWHSAAPCAFRFDNATARLLDTSCSAHVVYAAEDAMDNHYALAGALGLPAAATLLLDELLTLQTCMA